MELIYCSLEDKVKQRLNITNSTYMKSSEFSANICNDDNHFFSRQPNATKQQPQFLYYIKAIPIQTMELVVFAVLGLSSVIIIAAVRYVHEKE